MSGCLNLRLFFFFAFFLSFSFLFLSLSSDSLPKIMQASPLKLLSLNAVLLHYESAGLRRNHLVIRPVIDHDIKLL